MATAQHASKTFSGYTLATCPDRATHTECPDGYLAWHEWAERMAKTHVQRRCATCQLWAVWEPKKTRAKP